MTDQLYVAPIDFKDGKRRHVIVKARVAYDGGMREFIDPVTDEVVGCCGVHFFQQEVLPLDVWKGDYERQ